LVIGAIGGSAHEHAASGGISCPLYATTSVPCPLCGMSRATMSLGAGDLGGAFGAHPVFPLVLAFALWGGSRLALGRSMTVRGKPITVVHVLIGVSIVWAINLAARGIG
jgi:hypothetical protein